MADRAEQSALLLARIFAARRRCMNIMAYLQLLMKKSDMIQSIIHCYSSFVVVRMCENVVVVVVDLY